MNVPHRSNSAEQQYAERIIFESVEQRIGFKLQENPKLFLYGNKGTHIEPDFYSEEHSVIGEIFSHVGECKAGQTHKIAQDILKMLLFDDVKGIKHRKIFVVCDEKAYKRLRGNSYLAECIRRFDIEIMGIDVGTELKNTIAAAQKRQGW